MPLFLLMQFAFYSSRLILRQIDQDLTAAKIKSRKSMNIDYIMITAQVIGLAAMIATVLSLQCRSNQNFYRCQTAGGILFMLNFLLLGAWSGALMNVYSILRPELLRREKIANSKWILPVLLGMLLTFCIILLVFSSEKWYLILAVFIAQAGGTCAMATQNGKLIRFGQLFVVSPLWMIYNLLLPIPSMGGIICETINIISTLVALFRYRKIGFTQK